MHKVISKGIWKDIRVRARKARHRKVAIAYVTQDLVGFRKGDVLISDASQRAIANGETDASLLRRLLKKGVHLYDCADLHAKVLLLDDVAVIGSANMSQTSAKHKVEAGFVTDQSSIVSAVASFIEQLIQQSRELRTQDVAALCKIRVVRRGGRFDGSSKRKLTKVTTLGNRTWLIGVRELVNDPVSKEQTLIDRAMESLRKQTAHTDADISWIRWGTRGRFARECRAGDTVIQIWRSAHAKRPSAVYKAVPVLLKQKTDRWTRFYLADPKGRYAEIGWGNFKRLIKEIGYSRRVSAGVVQFVEPDIADAIDRKWSSAARP